jgi:hypothetical protein
VQLSVTVCAPAATGMLPLARTTFQSSRTCQSSVSLLVARVVSAIVNAWPRANVRVPSLPGVSASIRSLPAAAALGADGAPHESASPPAATIGVIEPLAALACPDALVLELPALAPLLTLLLVPPPPPPPPQAVNVTTIAASAAAPAIRAALVRLRVCVGACDPSRVRGLLCSFKRQTSFICCFCLMKPSARVFGPMKDKCGASRIAAMAVHVAAGRRLVKGIGAWPRFGTEGTSPAGRWPCATQMSMQQLNRGAGVRRGNEMMCRRSFGGLTKSRSEGTTRWRETNGFRKFSGAKHLANLRTFLAERCEANGGTLMGRPKQRVAGVHLGSPVPAQRSAEAEILAAD